MTFDGLHVSRVCGKIAVVVEEVSASSDAGTVWFGLLGAYVDGESWVCHCFAYWDIGTIDPFQDVHAFGVEEPLEEAAEFIFARSGPSVSGDSIGVFAQVSVCGKLLQLLIADGSPGHCHML